MPIDLSDYPPSWPKIAAHVKLAADYTCQECGRPCRRPGESALAFEERWLSGPRERWDQAEGGDSNAV